MYILEQKKGGEEMHDKIRHVPLYRKSEGDYLYTKRYVEKFMYS